MGYIFRIEIGLSIKETSDLLGHIPLNRNFIKELGEPLYYDENHEWVFCFHGINLVGFTCFNGNKILFMLVLPEYRKQGILQNIYNRMPNRQWWAICNNLSLQFFMKNNFEVVKSFKNWHKVKLK